MDIDALIEAGLYDADAVDAADRLALLRFLADAGATVEDMVAADGAGNLTSLATDLRLRGGTLSAAELAGASGTGLSTVVELYRQLGIAVEDVDERRFTEDEVRLLELAGLARTTLPDDVADEVLRAIGAALAVVAESAVAAFVGTVEDELARGSQHQRAEITSASGELGLELGAVLAPLLRHHLWAAVQRQRAAMEAGADRLDTKVAVGFVDLVGFTAASAAMDRAELLAFIRRFHSRTWDIVTGAGGRVVKHIGDEIMFTAPDPVTGCAIALAVVEAFGEPGAAPRGGVAHGTVVARHGDYYGPIVNLAARLADIAVPGEVLVDADTAARLDASLVVTPAGRRQLKGFGEPVTVCAVDRSAGIS